MNGWVRFDGRDDCGIESMVETMFCGIESMGETNFDKRIVVVVWKLKKANIFIKFTTAAKNDGF